MHHRLFASSLFLAAFTLVACGSPFEAGSHSGLSGGDDDSDSGEITATGPEGGTVVVEPNTLPDGAPREATDATTDATKDATEDAHAGDSGDSDVIDAGDDATLNQIPDAAPDATDSNTEPPDTGPACTSTEKLCGDQCVSKTNPATGCAATSCTPCSLTHTTTATCDTNGECAPEVCTAGYEHCTGPGSNGCETPISTATNCGSCGHACTVSDPLCSASGNTFTCTSGCPSNDVLCNSACVNEATSAQDCGGCSSGSQSYACTAPTNGSPLCAASKCGFTCNTGFNECNNNACVSFTTDPTNCNGCGAKCPVPTHGTATCAPGAGNVGKCGIACTSPYSACNGVCDDEQTDVNNCGGCGSACPVPAHGSATCAPNGNDVGTCGITCSGPYSVCGSACVDEQTDTNNCGGCTTGGKSYACSAPANATATCAPAAGNPSGPGTCGFTCNSGFVDCNGVCVNENTDNSNCGQCNKTCGAVADGTDQCTGGSCKITCATNYALCNTDECVNESTDNDNCGACNKICGPVANGSDQCAGGLCKVTCATDYVLCNTNECVNENTDNNNCGTCDHVCPAPPAFATDNCLSGACTVVCNTNYQLCNGACVQADPTAVFVSSSSSATSGCGVIGTPCKTIAAGIAYATANGKTHIYVDHGTYAEQVTLTNGLTIEGGWEYGGGSTWSKECVAGVDQSSVTIIAPTSGASAVIAKDVTATLSTLTIHNNTTASTGESLFGIFAASSGATNDTNLTLDAVEVTVQAGGSGNVGGAGTAPGLPTGNVPPCATAGNGATGGAATPVTGFLTANQYSSAGATPGAGKAANAGNAGANGADPTVTVGSCVTGSVCNAGGNCDTGPQQCGTEGTHGCGGPGGPPGLGGGGGGASIALYAWEATVHVSGGSFTGGKGGNGGAGGNGATVAAVASWTGMNGAVGTGGHADNCKQTVNTCATQKTGAAFTGGPAGESGGAGSAGGNGVSGPGGDSYGYYSGTGASVVVSGSPTFAASSAGTTTGPNPSAPVSGSSAAHN